MKKIDQINFPNSYQLLNLPTVTVDNPPRKAIDKIFGFNRKPPTPLINSHPINISTDQSNTNMQETLSHYVEEISNIKRENKEYYERISFLEAENQKLIDSLETRKALVNSKVVEENDELKEKIKRYEEKLEKSSNQYESSMSYKRKYTKAKERIKDMEIILKNLLFDKEVNKTIKSKKTSNHPESQTVSRNYNQKNKENNCFKKNEDPAEVLKFSQIINNLKANIESTEEKPLVSSVKDEPMAGFPLIQTNDFSRNQDFSLQRILESVKNVNRNRSQSNAHY